MDAGLAVLVWSACVALWMSMVIGSLLFIAVLTRASTNKK